MQINNVVEDRNITRYTAGNMIQAHKDILL